MSEESRAAVELLRILRVLDKLIGIDGQPLEDADRATIWHALDPDRTGNLHRMSWFAARVVTLVGFRSLGEVVQEHSGLARQDTPTITQILNALDTEPATQKDLA